MVKHVVRPKICELLRLRESQKSQCFQGISAFFKNLDLKSVVCTRNWRDTTFATPRICKLKVENCFCLGLLLLTRPLLKQNKALIKPTLRLARSRPSHISPPLASRLRRLVFRWTSLRKNRPPEGFYFAHHLRYASKYKLKCINFPSA